jgi:AraC-like DNA-binding protein
MRTIDIKKMEKVRQRLDEVALRHDLSIEAVASEFGMCRSNLIRTFRKIYVKAPMQYCQDIKLKKAIEMLREDKYMMKEIAEEIGQQSIFHFSKWFKQHTGSSPTQYDFEDSSIVMCDY